MKTFLTFLGGLLLATAAQAGTFSTAAWIDDACTGIVSGQTAWAYHFGDTPTATVDGVSVTGLAGPTASTADFTLVGTDLMFNADSSNLTALTGTGSAIIAHDFVYDGNPATITLNALTAGQTYTVSVLSVAFEDAGTRTVTFASGSDNLLVDQGQFGNDNGIRVDYTFTATAATRVISITPANVTNATFHLYGLALCTETAPTTVTNTNDSGTGSLRWALRNAADRAGADAISFAPGFTGPIVLSSEIVINDSTGAVTIDASALSTRLTIDGGPGTNRIFSMAAGSNLSLTGLTLTGGDGGGATQNGVAGAILNSGTLLLTGCTVSGNSASGAGAISSPPGSTLTLVQCTLSGNRTTSATASGGAIVSSGILTLTQCTLSGNQCDSTVGGGGAIRTASPGTATLTNCTFAGNSAPSGLGGAISHLATQMTLTHCTFSGNSAKTGGAIYTTSSALTLVNSIIAGNTAEFYPDVISSGTPATTGVNFIGDLIGSNLTAGSAILTGDPLLAPLASNGGPTQTMALRAGSPALDAATVIGGLATDQRDFTRIRDGNGDGTSAPDLGAFEASCLVVTTATDELDASSPNGTGISLREALRDGVDLITFAPGFTGPIVLGSEIIVSDTTRNVAVDASTLPSVLTIDGGPGTNRLFTVSNGGSLTLRGLALTGGNSDGTDLTGYGGAFLNRGTLTLSHCTLSGNFAANGNGGAIYSFGSVMLTQCALSGNAASQGGGAISNRGGTVTLTHCTLSGNASYGDSGGAVYSSGTVSTSSAVKVTLTHCTLAGNSASFSGGAIYSLSSTVTLANSIVAGNTSSFSGPDIRRVTSGSIIPIGANFIGDIADSTLTASSTILTTAVNGPVNLAPLAHNGGPTQTMALRPGSPALDAVAAVNEVAGLTTDQRGFPRNLDGDGTGGVAVDIGAFELQRIVVTTATDELDAISASGTGISLREALRDSLAGGVITFDVALANFNILVTSQLEVAKSLTIDASNFANGKVVSGVITERVFRINPGVSASFIRLTINQGLATGSFPNNYGGGVYVEGALALTECTIKGNSAFVGGGIFVAPSGTVTLDRSTVSGNNASVGGGIQNEGTLFCTNSTFANNTATMDGGAISAPFSKPVTLRHCTVSLNTAATGGGVMGNAITLENSIVAGNTAPTGPNLSGTPILIGANVTSGETHFIPVLLSFGGPTQVLLPVFGSPALDQAVVSSSSPTVDQRGSPRPVGLRPDIGAVEADTLIVTTPVDELNSPGIVGNGYSLREAIRDVPTNGGIVFDRAIFTGATVTTNTITLTQGPLNPQRTCFVDGTGNPGGIKIIQALTITQQPQSQAVNAGSIAQFDVTVTAVSGGLSHQWRKNGQNLPATLPSLSFNAQEGGEGVYDVVVSEALPPGVLTLFSVTMPPATVTSQPASLIVDGAPVTIQRGPGNAMIALGSSHTLSVVAVGPGTLTYQWMLNGKAISGAKSRTYTIAKAALTHAGTYSCVVKSGTNTAPPVMAEIGVVDTTPKTVNLKASPTASFTATVNAAGNGPLTFAWLKNGGGTAFSTKSFTIMPAAVSDAGLYTCVVTGAAGVFTGGAPTRVNISDGVPQFFLPLAPPRGAVGQFYYWQIPVMPNVGAPATSFSVAGPLPAGLTLNAVTGVISGRITATKSAGFPLTIKASNAKGSSLPAMVTLMVDVVPTDAVGVFTGPLERSAFTGFLGGRFDLTTTSAGSFSGSLTLGSRPKIGFTAQLLRSAGAGDVILYGSIPGITLADKTPLTAYVEVFAAEQLARLTLLQANGSTLAATAWRNPWNTKTKPATAYAASYTARLDADALLDVPDGYGYTSFTVKPDGSLTLVGKLPDGSDVTGGTFVGPKGQILLFNLLYANRGSHVGQFTITPGSPVANNAISGRTNWYKPGPLPNSKDTVYKDGFGPFGVTFDGSPYVPPAKGQRIMGLGVAPNPNAKLNFDLGDLPQAFAQLLHITNPSATGLTNKATLAAPVTHSTKVTTLDAAKGLFSGNFQINGATPALHRPAPFYGQLVTINGFTRGYGYFLLPSVPTGTEKVTTSPKQSGTVVLGVP